MSYAAVAAGIRVAASLLREAKDQEDASHTKRGFTRTQSRKVSHAIEHAADILNLTKQSAECGVVSNPIEMLYNEHLSPLAKAALASNQAVTLAMNSPNGQE